MNDEYLLRYCAACGRLADSSEAMHLDPDPEDGLSYCSLTCLMKDDPVYIKDMVEIIIAGIKNEEE